MRIFKKEQFKVFTINTTKKACIRKELNPTAAIIGSLPLTARISSCFSARYNFNL